MDAYIYPFLRYQDMKAAVDWLGAAFGFEPMMVVDGHAELRLGDGMIMIGNGKSPKQRGAQLDKITDVEQGLYLYVADVDAHHAQAKAAGAKIVREIEATEYGSREYAALDLDGYYWSFGTYGPGREGAAGGGAA
jgi:uncharacterized glyoxalase superfamily protein PhnB